MKTTCVQDPYSKSNEKKERTKTVQSYEWSRIYYRNSKKKTEKGDVQDKLLKSEESKQREHRSGYVL